MILVLAVFVLSFCVSSSLLDTGCFIFATFGLLNLINTNSNEYINMCMCLVFFSLSVFHWNWKWMFRFREHVLYIVYTVHVDLTAWSLSKKHLILNPFFIFWCSSSPMAIFFTHMCHIRQWTLFMYSECSFKLLLYRILSFTFTYCSTSTVTVLFLWWSQPDVFRSKPSIWLWPVFVSR